MGQNEIWSMFKKQSKFKFQEQEMFVIEFSIITITDIPHGTIKENSALVTVKGINFICEDHVKHLGEVLSIPFKYLAIT